MSGGGKREGAGRKASRGEAKPGRNVRLSHADTIQQQIVLLKERNERLIKIVEKMEARFAMSVERHYVGYIGDADLLAELRQVIKA